MPTPYASAQSSTDPFAGGQKTPALSWKGLPIGTVFVCRVLEPAKLLHSRDFETNEPAYWDLEKTQPKMSAVINVTILDGPHSVGEDRSIWAQKPSQLFQAIAQAQKEAGAQIGEGGVLRLKFAGETPHENKRYSPIKNYLAKYEPPAARDAFETPTPAPVGQQPQYARPATTTTAPAPQAPPAGWPQQARQQPGLPGVPPAQPRW